MSPYCKSTCVRLIEVKKLSNLSALRMKKIVFVLKGGKSKCKMREEARTKTHLKYSSAGEAVLPMAEVTFFNPLVKLLFE